MSTLVPLMIAVAKADAFWSLIGGAGYAVTRMSTTLWGGREVAPRARKLAIAQFVVSLVLAPAAGHAMTPVVVAYWPLATHAAAALLVGLLFNAAWPLVVQPKFMRQLIADLFRGIADRLTPGAPS